MSIKNTSAVHEQACPAMAVRAAFAKFGVTAAQPGEIEEARTFAARLIGGELASAETIATIHQRTGAALFVTRDSGELTGVGALVLLSAQGLEAVRADRFDGVEPDPDHIAAFGEAPAAVYNWGVAVSRFRQLKRLFDGYDLIRREALPWLAFYGKPVTDAGWRFTRDRLQFEPFPGSTTGLVWAQPLGARSAGLAA